MKPKRSIKIGNQVSYNGGQKAIAKFVQNELKYPEEALKNKIEGYVQLKYDINHKGQVFQCHILKSIGYGCDEEAIRIVKLLKFNVTKSRGLRSIYHKKIRIQFKLPISKPSITSEFQYQFKEKANKTDKEKKKKTSYSFQIKINQSYD